ncbi:MAG: HAD family phosphatase [Phycisphaerales bacterium]|nr:HAD family phosphatase [Phycisphaerales bacterium]
MASKRDSKAPTTGPKASLPGAPSPGTDPGENDLDALTAPPTEGELAELAAISAGPRRRFDALICDIDGCLVPENMDPLDAPALGRIAEHNKIAIKTGLLPVVTLCSGRPQPFVEAMCRLLHNTVLPCIAENGVWMYFPATNEYHRDPTISRDHMQAVHEAELWAEAELYPRGFSIQPGKTASVSFYHPDMAQLDPIMPVIEGAFKREGWPLRVSRTTCYVNCDLEHISKATGLDWLIAAAGLNPDRLAGFGDSQSDIPIAERVNYFACPSHHDPKLGAMAHHISTYHEAWAVLDVLERVLAE